MKNIQVFTDFKFDPIDKRFVSPKPKNSVDEKLIIKLEEANELMISRKRDGYSHNIVSNRFGKIKLYTRTGNEVTDLYPELIQDLKNHHIPKKTIIAAELVVDEDGRDAFPKVGKLAKTEINRSQILAEEGLQANLMPYNMLVTNGEWLHQQTNEYRFEKIFQMFGGITDSLVLPFELLDIPYQEALTIMRNDHWEGLVLYNRFSQSGFSMDGRFSQPYRPNGSWKKKDKFEDDFVAIEKIPSSAKSWEGALKEFRLIQYDSETGDQIDCGKIGVGMTKQQRYEFMDDEKFPLPLVVQVEFNDRFVDRGKGTLRHGNFITARYDKAPEECLFYKEEYKHTPAKTLGQ